MTTKAKPKTRAADLIPSPGVMAGHYSTHQRIHNAPPNSELGRLLRTIPEWCEAASRLSKLAEFRTWVAGAPNPETVIMDVVTEVLDADTRPDLNDLVTRAGVTHSTAAGAVVLTEAANRLQGTLNRDLDAAIDLDGLAAALNQRLTETLTAAAPSANALGSDVEFESAHGRGLVDELTEFRSHYTTYADIRRAQALLIRSATATGHGSWKDGNAPAALLYIRGAVALDPECLVRDVYRAWVSTDDGTRRATPTSPLPDEWNSIEAFTWQVHHPEAQPWVPTLPEFLAAAAAFRDARRQLSTHATERDDRKFYPLEAIQKTAATAA